jgi:hypothetical protein
VDENGSSVAGAVASCRWAGPDEVASTDDDVEYSALTDEGGQFTLTDLPLGLFNCSVTDPTIGAVSAAEPAEVNGNGPTTMVLPFRVSRAALPTRTGFLARTGATAGPLLSAGLLLSGLGWLCRLAAARAGARRWRSPE